MDELKKFQRSPVNKEHTMKSTPLSYSRLSFLYDYIDFGSDIAFGFIGDHPLIVNFIDRIGSVKFDFGQTKQFIDQEQLKYNGLRSGLVYVNYDITDKNGMIWIYSKTGIQPGDSGSLVVDNNNVIIGVLGQQVKNPTASNLVYGLVYPLREAYLDAFIDNLGKLPSDLTDLEEEENESNDEEEEEEESSEDGNPNIHCKLFPTCSMF